MNRADHPLTRRGLSPQNIPVATVHDPLAGLRRHSSSDRAHPRPWSAAWYPLRELARVLPVLLAAHGLDRPGLDVLDFGSGDAPYRHLFHSSGSYVTADLGDGADLEVGPRSELPRADSSIDVVVSFQVLEHVEDVDSYLSEARRVLRPGGALLLSTHGVWPYHPHPTDFWRWTVEGLRLVVDRAGFVIRDCRGVVGPLGWTDQVRLAGLQRLLSTSRASRGLMVPVALAYNAKIWVEDRCTPSAMVDRDPSVVVLVARKPHETAGRPPRPLVGNHAPAPPD